MINVRSKSQHLQVVRPDDGLGVFVEEAGIGLEMDDASGTEEAAVALEEQRRGEAGILAAAELRVGESEPDLGDFARAEERVDELDPGAQEGDIAHRLLGGFLRSLPEPRPFDVHADEIHLRVPTGQGDRVIPFPTAQFQDDGLRLRKHVPVPVPLDGVVPKHQFPGALGLGQYRRCIRLQQAAERLVLRKFLEFTVSHQNPSLLRFTIRPMPRRPSGGSTGRTVRVQGPHSSGRTPARYGTRTCREKGVVRPSSGI